MGRYEKSKMIRTLGEWWRDEDGATAIEYGLMAGLIAFAIIGGATALGDALNANFEEAETALKDAMPED